MPTYQIIEVLIRIGLALGAGVLIALVPIAHRRTRYEPSIAKRIFYHLVTLVALVAFCYYSYYLWNRFVPREPEEPAPVSYPETPATPALPPGP